MWAAVTTFYYTPSCTFCLSHLVPATAFLIKTTFPSTFSPFPQKNRKNSPYTSQSPVLLQTATAEVCSSRDLGPLPPPLQQEPLASHVAAPMALEHLYGGVHAPSSNRKAGGGPKLPVPQLLEGLCGEMCRGGPARCPTPAPGEQGALVQPRPYATGQLLPPEGRKTLMETITQLSVTARRACFSL